MVWYLNTGTDSFTLPHTRVCIYIYVHIKSLCLTKHHAMKAYWGSGGIAPRILDLGTRWR
jgi:hypothetical protein